MHARVWCISGWVSAIKLMLFCADANKKKEKRTAVFVSNQLLCGVRALVRVIALSDCLNNPTAI
jgi:hypothetical protein